MDQEKKLRTNNRVAERGHQNIERLGLNHSRTTHNSRRCNATTRKKQIRNKNETKDPGIVRGNGTLVGVETRGWVKGKRGGKSYADAEELKRSATPWWHAGSVGMNLDRCGKTHLKTKNISQRWHVAFISDHYGNWSQPRTVERLLCPLLAILLATLLAA